MFNYTALYWYNEAKNQKHMKEIESNRAFTFFKELQTTKANIQHENKIKVSDEIGKQIRQKRKIRLGELENKIYKKKVTHSMELVQSIHSFKDIANLECIELDTSIDQIKQLQQLVNVSKEMESLIGLEHVKKDVYKMVLNQLHLSILKKKNPLAQQGLMNISIVGPPGTGKTTLAELLGKIFAATGTLTKGHLVIAKRVDFIGQFLGQTTPKTMKVMESALGGVLLIDEVYGLGGAGNKDSFAKEAIDTINEYMSQHADNLLVIIAGYKEDIKHNFFSQNNGLERRFPITLELNGYKGSELGQIYMKMVKKAYWDVSEEDKDNMLIFIESNSKEYTNHAGDMSSLLLHTKFEAAGRIWASLGTEENVITLSDLKKGHENLIKKRKESESSTLLSMYV